MQIGFIVVNQVEMQCGVQWLVNHLPSHKNNHIFIYFGMSLKMDDMTVLFLHFHPNQQLIANLSCTCNCKPLCSHVRLQVIFIRCHTRQLWSITTKSRKHMSLNGHHLLWLFQVECFKFKIKKLDKKWKVVTIESLNF